ncbi:molybdopterin converting factor subunit 1 [Jannaschia sp. CCS1]|uniref:molybdopterin converting factor subunit 1 n=1 Tax=Jannaschia sp. (strain CCS1) TaxID=290400 RepID=UPI000053B7CE|nr:molybdopterin converting factor subunit 1 [Jannaschia sp. CCS1]ABD56834.1 molybdopterin synthase subunit MoaD [Jannaschia sp. CCS1]
MDLRYFAWLRERIGTAHEVVETDATTVAELIEELKGRSDAHAYALSDLKAVRAAVDQTLVDFDTPLKDAREVALFPPMTGG